MTIRSTVNLAGLQPSDVRVEAIIGRVGINDHLEETEVIQLRSEGTDSDGYVFVNEFIPQQTGRLGFSIRVSPNHFEDPLTRPCNSLMKWA